MQELLAKTDDPTIPLEDQEYYELLLDDLGFPFRPQTIDSLGTMARHRFIVREAHAAWSAVDRIVIWDRWEHDEYPTVEEAVRGYEDRRSALVAMGFVYSDMDYTKS